jgi:CMP-N-acetylneuraminic acid synthetase
VIKFKDKTLCFIPARGGSERLKNKNLKKISGKTLVEITCQLAKKSGLFELQNIVLSSDDHKILKIGKKLKIKTLLRSSLNSRSISTTDSALAETLNKLKKKFDYIVILQVTSPLRTISTLKKFVFHCIKNKINSCLTVSIIDDNVSKFSNFFNPFEKKRNSQLRKGLIYENSLIYYVSGSFFNRFKKIYPKKKWSYFITNKYESLDINSKEDYLICKKIYEKN